MTSRSARVLGIPGLAASLICASLVACQDPRGELDLDAYGAPSYDCVEVVDSQLELSGPLHHFVADGGSSAGGWALVSVIGMQGPELALERVPATGAELPTPIIELELPPSFAAFSSLQAGASAGELWAFIDAPNLTLLSRAVPELGELVRNDLLANFPIQAVGVGDCPTTHSRLLLLVEGQPYMLALPDCSEDPGLVLDLLSLDPDLLAFGQSWQLEFDPCADTEDPASCALLLAYSVPEISRGSATTFPAARESPVGFTQLRVFNQLLPDSGTSASYDLSLLDMQIGSEGPQARLITYRGVWAGSNQIQLGPITSGEDLYSTQLFVRNQLGEGDAALLRFDTALEQYELLRDDRTLPFAGAGELIQLRDRSAMFNHDDEGLHAIDLADADSWPSWAPTTLVAAPDISDFEQAGVGHILLRRNEAAAQLLRINCVE